MEKFNITNTSLGKKITHPEKYSPSLLFRIPRSENRIRYYLEDENLPFTGFDVWNCYEVSFLTKNGLPVSRIIKLIYPAESKFLLESKSLKLYLNSFNMECFKDSISESEKQVKKIIKKDLTRLLEADIHVILFDRNSSEMKPFINFSFPDITNLIPANTLENIHFTKFCESPELLKGTKKSKLYKYSFSSDVLRSNCRVTKQPDWGDLFVRMESFYEIDLSSLLAYLVSFRKENHFHEEVVEMIYKRFYDTFEPEKLMVAAMYTRRGGIDINPIRVSYNEWLDEAFISISHRLTKTWRQ